MADLNPLNLADLDPAIWYVRVDRTDYGPFTRGQMTVYFEEERISSSSLVRKGRTGDFAPAASFTSLSELPTSASFEAPLILGELKTYAVTISCQEKGGDEARALISQTLNTLGSFVETMNHVYLLRSAQSVGKIRHTLSDMDMPDMQAVIFESPNGLGWLGLGDDLDAHIRSFWEMNKAS